MIFFVAGCMRKEGISFWWLELCAGLRYVCQCVSTKRRNMPVCGTDDDTLYKELDGHAYGRSGQNVMFLIHCYYC